VRPPYRLVWNEGIEADFRALAAIDHRLVRIAQDVAADVAGHHSHGNALGERRVSGDLTGYYRMRFDLPGRRPLRFRLVYDRPDEGTVRVIGMGQREASAVYRALAARRMQSDNN